MAYSMNHPHGMCPDCTGLGVRVQLDEERMFDREKSIREGAIRFSQFSTGSWQSFYYYNNPQLDPDQEAAGLHPGGVADPANRTGHAAGYGLCPQQHRTSVKASL